MSSIITAAKRRRALLLATSFPCPSYRWHFRRPGAAGVAGSSCRRSRSAPPTDPNKTRARPLIDGRRPRAASGADAPSRGAGTGTSDGATRPCGAAPAPAVRQFNGIVGASSTVITARGHRPFAVADLPDILAQVPGVQLTTLYGGRERREDYRRPARLRRLRDLQYADPDQRPPAQRRRHGAGRSVDHSAPLDRAHRNHPRQQRRGAVRRQRGRRRHQHRHQDRCRRPAGGDARRGRRRLVQQRMASLGSDQLRPVVDLVLRQRHQVRRLSRQQRARPEERRRQPQLHHARPQGLPHRDRRRPEARLPRRAHRRSLDRRQSARHRPQGHQHAVRLRQPAGRQRDRRLHQDHHGRRRPDRRRRRARQEAAGRLLRHVARRFPSTMSTATCRPGRSRRD